MQNPADTGVSLGVGGRRYTCNERKAVFKEHLLDSFLLMRSLSPVSVLEVSVQYSTCNSMYSDDWVVAVRKGRAADAGTDC